MENLELLLQEKNGIKKIKNMTKETSEIIIKTN
jgi:hypothetical protein